MSNSILNIFSFGHIGKKVMAGQKWILDGNTNLEDAYIVEKVSNGMVQWKYSWSDIVHIEPISEFRRTATLVE